MLSLRDHGYEWVQSFFFLFLFLFFFDDDDDYDDYDDYDDDDDDDDDDDVDDHDDVGGSGGGVAAATAAAAAVVSLFLLLLSKFNFAQLQFASFFQRTIKWRRIVASFKALSIVWCDFSLAVQPLWVRKYLSLWCPVALEMCQGLSSWGSNLLGSPAAMFQTSLAHVSDVSDVSFPLARIKACMDQRQLISKLA